MTNTTNTIPKSTINAGVKAAKAVDVLRVKLEAARETEYGAIVAMIDAGMTDYRIGKTVGRSHTHIGNVRDKAGKPKAAAKKVAAKAPAKKATKPKATAKKVTKKAPAKRGTPKRKTAPIPKAGK